MGHDDYCYPSPSGQCAWFVFQDQYDRAVIFTVGTSDTWLFGNLFYGLDPSGAYGQVGSERRKMVAYFTNRTGGGQVRAKFFDDSMNEIGDVTVWEYYQPWVEVYQTASAWDPISQTFLIAWTEVDKQVNHRAAVLHRTIHWSWVMGPPSSPAYPAIVCANGGAEDCGDTRTAGESAPLVGPCVCSRLWVTSGMANPIYYDSFRMYSYDAMARLASNGYRVGWRGIGSQFLPLTQLNRVSTPSGTAVYQSIDGSGYLSYWTEGNENNVLQNQVLWRGAEAFRAELRFVAAAVGSDLQSTDLAPATLKLSVVPFGTPAATCPR